MQDDLSLKVVDINTVIDDCLAPKLISIESRSKKDKSKVRWSEALSSDVSIVERRHSHSEIRTKCQTSSFLMNNNYGKVLDNHICNEVTGIANKGKNEENYPVPHEKIGIKNFTEEMRDNLNSELCKSKSVPCLFLDSSLETNEPGHNSSCIGVKGSPSPDISNSHHGVHSTNNDKGGSAPDCTVPMKKNLKDTLRKSMSSSVLFGEFSTDNGPHNNFGKCITRRRNSLQSMKRSVSVTNLFNNVYYGQMDKLQSEVIDADCSDKNSKLFCINTEISRMEQNTLENVTVYSLTTVNI